MHLKKKKTPRCTSKLGVDPAVRGKGLDITEARSQYSTSKYAHGDDIIKSGSSGYRDILRTVHTCRQTA